MPNILVSVITPTYNHEKFIGECIDSLLGQTFVDWEQIIVDDGSTDRTKTIISQYNDPRITYLYQDNKGIARLNETYNLALARCRGKYIAILEGDDYWAPEKLTTQLELFQNHGADLVWGAVDWVNTTNEHMVCVPVDPHQFKGLSQYQYLDRLMLTNFIPAVTVMLKKDILLDIGGFQQPERMLTVDYPTWLAYLSRAGTIALTEQPLASWRRHPVQMSTARQQELLNNTMLFALDFYDSLPESIQKMLTVNRDVIKNTWERHIAESCFYEGRKKLIRHQWPESRTDFIYAFRYGNFLHRIKSALGVLAGFLHRDLEYLARATGKEPITEKELMI